MAKTVTLVAGVDLVPFDPFRTIKEIHWDGRPFILIRGTVTPSGAAQSIGMTASFPNLLAGPPTLILIDNINPPADMPLFSVPIGEDDITGDISGRFVGFTRRIPFTPPPTPAGGSGAFYLKIDLSNPDFQDELFRIRISVTGIVGATIDMQVATYKKVKVGDLIEALDFESVQTDSQAHPSEDPPLSYSKDFNVDPTTLTVTML